MNIQKNQRGFTIIEIIIAIVVLTVGVLGLVTTAALVTRMIARGQRSATAASFASRRLERLRAGACVLANRANGQVHAGHQDHRLETREHIARRVGVACRE